MVNPDVRHVCLICIELFGDSIYGGFGRATRFIGRELSKRGVRVSVVVPRRSPELPDGYQLDGMSVYQYNPVRPWQGIKVLRQINADIYHSQDTSTTSLLAQIARPAAVHVITFRDPMDRWDWHIETKFAGMSRLGWAQYRYFIDNPLVSLAVRRADSLHCAARFLEAKTAAMYRLRIPPSFLPTPVNVPASVNKATKPTACYVGRWEGRKRVELFLELAVQNPGIDFIAVGGARDPERDRELRQKYAGIDNLDMTGVLDQFKTTEWSDVLGKSWVIVNTSLREGLPTTFTEAAAHRCAILSFADPDEFASRFGVHATEGRLAEGLASLVAENNWKQAGEAGYQYVNQVFSVDRAMDGHLDLYQGLLEKKKAAK